MVKSVEEIENAIKQLTPEKLRQFREWYAKFDKDAWDEQIESDAATGNLDSIADSAVSDHKAGRSTLL